MGAAAFCPRGLAILDITMPADQTPVPLPLLLAVALALVVLAVLIVAAVTVSRRRRLRRPVLPAPSPDTPGPAPVVALVLNPVKLGAAEAAELVARGCSAAGWAPPLVFETAVEDPGYGQARRALAAGADVVLAAGGDGTIREVARAVAGTGIPLGLVPLGTGNLLARALDLPVGRPEAAVAVALHGHTRRIDMGRVELENRLTGTRHRDAFLVMGGIGLDAEVIAATREDLKRRVGWLAYSEAGLRLLMRPQRRTRMSVALDGGAGVARKARTVLFANTGRMPAGIEFIPDARLDDGQLDVVVVSPRSVLGWAWVAGKAVTGFRRDIPVIEYLGSRRVTVTVEEPTATQLDGDVTGEATSVCAWVEPLALAVRVEDSPAAASAARPAA